MSKFRTADEVMRSCKEKGLVLGRAEVDFKKIKANLAIAHEDMESADDSARQKRWNSAYKLFYDVLHILVESLLCFDKVKSLNHQCLFAYLCTKHPDLELSWEFFEKIRTKRNGINYYGQPVTEEDWKSVEVQVKLYITTLKKEIEKKLHTST